MLQEHGRRRHRGYRIYMETQVAVVGAGAAGLYAALCAARAGARVLLVSATPLAESASYWAQGGLAAPLAADDSPDRHLEDTVAAGRRSPPVFLPGGQLLAGAPPLARP